MKLLSLLIKKIFGKTENELQKLDKSCDDNFRAVFENCRFELGRELVEVMEIKKNLMCKGDNSDSFSPVQEMLVKKTLELICLYFKLSDSYVSVKRLSTPNEEVIQNQKIIRDKLDSIFTIICSLNNQFYIKTYDFTESSDNQLLINEAQALCNALKENNLKKW